MERLLRTYLCVGWVVSLLAGCGADSPNGGHLKNASDERGATSGNHTRERKRKMTRKMRNSGGLKGKGSNAETISRRATAKRMISWNVTADKVMAVAPLVEQAAQENGLPVSLIYGVIWVESRFNPEAVSSVGAKGLMQLMPRTAEYLAECMAWDGDVDSFDPVFNIAAGSYYVARLIKQFDGDVDLALAAYNAGPGNIRRWMGNTGLPKVSIEYYTMVQTAQTYFPSNAQQGTDRDADILPSDEDLDRLGLAILIAGLSHQEFGLLRSDDANPFDEM